MVTKQFLFLEILLAFVEIGFEKAKLSRRKVLIGLSVQEVCKRKSFNQTVCFLISNYYYSFCLIFCRFWRNRTKFFLIYNYILKWLKMMLLLQLRQRNTLAKRKRSRRYRGRFVPHSFMRILIEKTFQKAFRTPLNFLENFF